jgi:hypothetical protein
MARDHNVGIQVPGIGDRWDPLDHVGHDPYVGSMRPAWEGSRHDPDNRARSHVGKGPKNWKRTDARLHEDVCDALAHDAHVDASGIEVIVTDGEVFLTGLVGDRNQKRHAEHVAERVSGVLDVHNRLEIPRSGPPPDPNESGISTDSTVSGTTRESSTGHFGVTS